MIHIMLLNQEDPEIEKFSILLPRVQHAIYRILQDN